MESSNLVSNDRVDRHGRIADKRTTGGWKAAPFIISMNQILTHMEILHCQNRFNNTNS